MRAVGHEEGQLQGDAFREARVENPAAASALWVGGLSLLPFGAESEVGREFMFLGQGVGDKETKKAFDEGERGPE